MASPIIVFNEQFGKLIDDIITVFPTNLDLKRARNAVLLLKRSNPKLISKIWRVQVTDKYAAKIREGDLSFFLAKDYTSDLEETHVDSPSDIVTAISNLRDPIRQMGHDNQTKTMKYVEILCELSLLV